MRAGAVLLSLAAGWLAGAACLQGLLRLASDLCACGTGEALPLEVMFSREVAPLLRSPRMMAHTVTGAHPCRPQEAAARHAAAAPALSLPVYVPGWRNTGDDEAARALVSALLMRVPLVLVLDTSLVFCCSYVAAVSRVKTVARLLYRYIEQLHAAGVPPESIHIIGFSLGAHVAGEAGRLISSNMNRKLQRITALDPAEPCFSRSGSPRVGWRDAQFVQVVHTSALGLQEARGHMDVYVRGGGREGLRRSHARAWLLYAATARRPASHAAATCRTRQELAAGLCLGNSTLVGYGCDPRSRGLYLYHYDEAAVEGKDIDYKRNFGFLNWLL